MAKAYLMCGKICSGKSTYAEKLRRDLRAVLLSVDEITLALFGQDVGEMHDTYVERTERYLYAKSLEILECGIDVVLDWGLWTKRERDEARAFYKERGIPCEIHYLSVAPEVWREWIEMRNRAILAGETEAYFVDEGLMGKFDALFETPDRSEVDVWVEAEA